MPFNVRLAHHDRPRPPLHAVAGQKPTASSHVREFVQGISFGLGLVVVMSVAYWFVGMQIAGLPFL